MRHLKAGRKLGRSASHRKAMFRNMVTSLIKYERIRTTLAKAKEVRSKVEKTITLGKKGTLHARRRALRVVNQYDAVQKLFGPLSERYANRNGGYTRIIKIGNRRGDDAPMAFIELVDREEEKAEKPADTKKGAKTKNTAAEKKKAEEKKPAKKTAAKKPAEDEKKKSRETKSEKPDKKAAAKKTPPAKNKKEDK